MRWVLGAVPLFLVIVLGCSPEARDRVMHFFFEIPERETSAEVATDAAPVGAGPPAVVLPAAKFASVHEPYARQQCRECHDTGDQMQPPTDLPKACRPCHAEFFGPRVGHAPVKRGECDSCHEMHRSEYLKLLIQPVDDTCAECHDDTDDLSEAAHAVDDVDHCIKCHDPHFGTNKLLKPGQPTAGGPRAAAGPSYTAR